MNTEEAMTWLFGGGGQNPKSQSSIFTVDISSVIGDEYIPLFLDILRMVCIHTTIQLMCVIGAENGNVSFFSSDFVVLLLYVVLGVMLFWLVVTKVVRFT